MQRGDKGSEVRESAKFVGQNKKTPMDSHLQCKKASQTETTGFCSLFTHHSSVLSETRECARKEMVGNTTA